MRGVLLQSPANDREWLLDLPGVLPGITRARELVASGRGEDIVMRLPVPGLWAGKGDRSECHA